MSSTFFAPSARSGLLLILLSVTAGCSSGGGDGGGPMAPELPAVAGIWQITINPQPGTTCSGISGDTFQGTITQAGSEIFLRIIVEGVSGELVYDGSINASGGFTLQQSHIITFGDGSQGTTTSSVNGSFADNSLSAMENETLGVVGSNVTCLIVWRWIGNRISGSPDLAPLKDLRSVSFSPTT